MDYNIIMNTTKKVHFSIRTLQRIQREMLECSFECLDEQDQKILEAFDSDNYIIDDIE